MGSKSFLYAWLILLGLAACDDKVASTSESAQASQDVAQFHTAQAIQQLQKQLQINPNDFDALNRIGDLYFESGKYFLAIQSYDKALAVNPECAGCVNDRGLAQFYLGDTEGALASLDRAIAINPAYPNAWLSKGYVLFSAGRYREAVDPLRQVSVVDTSGALTAEADKFLAMIEERLDQE